MIKEEKVKSIFFGLEASLLLLFFYFLIMTLTRASYPYAVNELLRIKIFVVPLVVSFGIEVGLFFYARSCSKRK